MKVLHISTGDTTGAGLCAVRICESLIEHGVDSKVLVLCSKSKVSYVKGVYSKTRMFLHDLLHKLLRLSHIYLFEEDRLIRLSIKTGSSFSRPVTRLDISNHPWVQWADIIHLHWVDNFFDQYSFFQKVNKPIIWTIHDEGFFYGISHYHDLFNPSDKTEIKYFEIKKEMLSKCKDLSIVFLSRYFEQVFSQHPFVQGRDYFVINNSVDGELFYRHDRDQARGELGFTKHDIVLSFVAGRINDIHKGLNLLLQAIEIIGNIAIKVVAIGGMPESINNNNVVTTGVVKDPFLLSKILSASDFYVMPSLQEAFSQAPLEAMACGVPVIAFPVSGTEELITDFNGVRCNGFEVADLVEGLNKAFKVTYNSLLIRNDVIKRFSPNVIANRYFSVYEKCME